MGWPGPYSHSRLRAETETSLCFLDREKTKSGHKKCVEGPLENINWHSYFKRTLEPKHKAVLMIVTSLCVLSWELFGNLQYTVSQLQFT